MLWVLHGRSENRGPKSYTLSPTDLKGPKGYCESLHADMVDNLDQFVYSACVGLTAYSAGLESEQKASQSFVAILVVPILVAEQMTAPVSGRVGTVLYSRACASPNRPRIRPPGYCRLLPGLLAKSVAGLRYQPRTGTAGTPQETRSG